MIKQAVVIIAVMLSDNPIYASLDQSQTVQPQSPGSQTEGSPGKKLIVFSVEERIRTYFDNSKTFS